MKKIHLLLSFFAVLFISACCHNESVKCATGRLGVRVVGNFQTATPLIIRYKQDNAFDVTIDTLEASYVPTAGTDSAYLLFKTIDSAQTNAYMVSDSFGDGLVLGYDYKIFFPEDTLAWSITGLNASGSTSMEMSHCGDKAPAACVRSASSCVLNGTSIPTVGYSSAIGYAPFSYINLVR